MKHFASTFLRRLRIAGVLALAFGPGVHQALAAPGTLSQIPLYVGPTVEPNIFFLTDDSGSMDWSLMTPENDGVVYLTGLPYYYALPAPGNDFFWVVVSEEYERDDLGIAAPGLGVWRARNHDYNKVYYNPEITYTPWIGLDNGGAAFTDADPVAAPVDPFDASAGTVDLTDSSTSFSTDYPGESFFTISDYYPARYYTWTDSDSDGVVDPGDAHTLVEITDSATNMTSTPPAAYTGGPNRTDCAAAPVCTYAEEIQNFANWFSYYRSRELASKNAITAATYDLTGVRIGYGAINNSGVNIGVASMNLEPTSGNKKALFDKVYETLPFGSTPVRSKLHEVGLYYECESGNLLGASGSDCPILPAADAGMCQKNFAILMTDGFYNGSSPGITAANTDGDGDTAFDGGAYGDSHNYTLADVAMDYYERDLAPSLNDEVPVWQGSKDQASHQHMTTYTVAFGVSGTLDPEADDPTAGGFSWPNPSSGNAEKIDDLWHAAYNGRGEFYSAQDPASLTEGLKSAFADASRGQSSSASVAFNTTSLDTGSLVFQARFNPSDNWKGELLATSLALDGTLSNLAWNSGDQLNAQSPSSRVIVTYDGTNGVAFNTLGDLSAAQQADLNMGPSGSPDGLGQARIDYLRGDRTDEGAGNNFRVRTNVLGDIVYSNPVYVGKAQSGYEDDPSFGDGMYSSFKTTHASRPGVIYIGANDGMLHGFWEADGTEAMAYMPNMIFSDQSKKGLHYLTDPTYEHRYYVDLSPTVGDAYVGGAWKTVLIGGYRGGERGLFALDVTDPASFSEVNANNMVMWEFTSDDDNGMGHSFSKPTIALMENDKWAAVFGNGYNDLGDGQAKLYIVYLEDGVDGSWGAGDYVVLSTGAGSTGDRNGLSTPALIDNDGNGKADRVYAGDLQGNLWAFDLSDTNDNQWDIAYKQGSTYKPLFNASVSGTAQPITSKPVVARNPGVATSSSNEPNLLVFFGTGQYMVNGDKANTDTQTFYGVWDDGTAASQLPHDRSDLVAQTLEASSTADIRVPTDNAVNYSAKAGWQFDLPTSGERVVVDPKIRGDYVFFNTLIPDSNTCNSQGYGWLMALKLLNGGRPDDPVFDVNNDGVVDDGDELGGDAPGGVRLDGIPAGSNFLDDVMYTPDDEGNIDVRKIDAGDMPTAGRRSWREVRE